MGILVTGGAGFIGSHFIERFAPRCRDSLICLDNFNDYYDPRLKRHNAERIARQPEVVIEEGDFCCPDFVDALFRRYDVRSVVHLGAYAGVRASVAQPLGYQQANVRGTLVLLEAVRQHPVERFLLVSSSTVYGKGASIPFREDAPLGIPASPYGATKRAAELMGLTYHQLHGVPVVILRPFSVYGPRLRPDLALSIFADAILKGTRLPLFGDGSIRRDYTHVADICQGLEAALESTGCVGQAINLGHSQPLPMREVIEYMERALEQKARIEYHPGRAEDLPATYADLAKASRLLGYEPKVPFQEGIVEFCRWYRDWHSAN